MLAALARLDPTDWGTGLSPANARACWRAAIGGLDVSRLGVAPRAGRPPRAVLLVASRNVFTAPLEWLVQLRALGVPVLVKPATGQERAVRAMAEALGGVDVRAFRGGDDAALDAALAEVDAVLAFGGAATIAALRTRVPPRVRLLGFGPRFGISVVRDPGAPTVLDHALYDGRGCMSPAAVFSADADLDRLAAAMADAEARLPRGLLAPAEAAALRARVLLARVTGAVREGPGWAVVRLPPEHWSPEALPRLLVVHPVDAPDAIAATLGPDRALLGTIATDRPLPATLVGDARVCAPGEMQCPPMTRRHDGVDVLEALWTPT